MAVKIYSPPPSQGVTGSKAFKVGMGFATGGPVGAGMALAGANNPALGALGSIAGAAGGTTGTKLEGGGSVADSTPQAVQNPASAVQRRYAALSADPKMTMMNGLNALRDPSVPDEIRQMYAEPLLRGKYAAAGRGIA